LLKRYASGIILALLLFPLIWFGSPLHFFFFSIAVILFVGKEAVGILNYRDPRLSEKFILTGIGWVTIAIFFQTIHGILACIPGLIILSFLVYWRKRLPLERTVEAVSATLFLMFYVGGLLAFIPLIRKIEPDQVGRNLLLFLIIVNYLGDTGAYHVGKSFGKHKLAPIISPNKTIEGSIGSIAASVIAGLLCTHLFATGFGYAETIVVSVCINVLGQFGDLVESTLKRSTGVKDSGTIIPGHGGVLDRTDSLFFNGPFLYFYWTLFKL
jgi:phosphatidate cytidylyltransferase